MVGKLYDVIIVGASVTGCRTAELISRKGYKVLVLEEHREIGEPQKCAGLVSWRLLNLLPKLPKEIMINKLNRAKFFSPSGKFFELKSKKSVYVIDRVKLDKYLAKKAMGSGAKIKTSTRFENFKYIDEMIELKTNKGEFKTKLLIGTDGVNSKIAKQANIVQPNNLLMGIQATVNGNFDPDLVELWFGSVAPNFFAWVIPENENKARIGLATKTNCKFYFDKFLKKRIGKIKKPNVGGLIRFGSMKNTVSDRILLVGDSACQVKPFSGGGIIYGLTASEYCATTCVKALKESRFNSNFLKKEYDKKWRERLEKSIRRGLLYRKILDKFSDKQLNFLFSSGKIIKLTKLLESWDMDLL